MNKGNIYLLDANIKTEPTSTTTISTSSSSFLLSNQSNKLTFIKTESACSSEQQTINNNTSNHIKEEPGHQYSTPPIADTLPILTKTSDLSEPINLFINNVVCSYSTRCHLNLRRIATEGMHVEYKKENGMVNMKLRKPYTTATIWSSGKVTCAGAKTEQDAYKAARRYCRLLQRMQFKVKMTNYRVVNVLATCNMPFGVDISRLAEKYQKECSYEPELHPGATYKIKDLKVTLKLFTTGSITLTSPSVLVAQQAISRIYPVLVEFKRILNNNSNNNINSNNSNNNISNNNNAIMHNTTTSNSTTQNHSPQSVISTIKLQNNNFNNKLTESITNSNQQPWLYQSKQIEPSANLTFNHKYNQTTSPLYASNIPQASSLLFNSHHHHLHTAYSTEPLLYSANLGTTNSSSNLTTNSFSSSLTTQQQQLPTPSYLSVTTSGVGLSSGSIFSPTNNSSSSLYSSTGSSQSQAPSHWYYDSLLVDNNVDDFLP